MWKHSSLFQDGFIDHNTEKKSHLKQQRFGVWTISALALKS